MTGRTVTAGEAAALGLVDKVVQESMLDESVDDLAHQLASGPTHAIGLSKQLINKVANLNLHEALELEACIQDTAGHTGDHQEAVAAFLGKRKPKFSGK